MAAQCYKAAVIHMGPYRNTHWIFVWHPNSDREPSLNPNLTLWWNAKSTYSINQWQFTECSNDMSLHSVPKVHTP